MKFMGDFHAIRTKRKELLRKYEKNMKNID